MTISKHFPQLYWHRQVNRLSVSCPLYRSVLVFYINTHKHTRSLRRCMENPKIQSEREAKGILFQALDWFHMR